VTAETSSSSGRGARLGRWLGPGLFLALWWLPVAGLDGAPQRLLAVVAWMAVWWVTEAAPLAATALLPLVLFPLLDVRAVAAVAPNYGNHMVFLFLGGFVLALAVERCGSTAGWRWPSWHHRVVAAAARVGLPARHRGCSPCGCPTPPPR
jgi:solute carrier family 13 (sodium-dependent dicarboxylate transporter), member 2/3/5